MTSDRQMAGGDDAPLIAARDPDVRAEASISKPPPSSASEDTDRGKKATFDRRTGEVSGSGASIGNPASGEDYDDDVGTGSGGDRKTGDPANAA